jgi:ectoine hydroxylase-related dioxygenase (phytanoyl-CoA dioxygenase family)
MNGFTTAAPRPTRDPEQARLDLDAGGCCLLEGVLSGDRLTRARDAVYRARDEDRAQGRASDFALDYGEGNVRVWNVLVRDPVFAELVQHPLALERIRGLIGWPALLGNLSANITEPGGAGGALHADQIFVPEPWPAQPQGINVAWCLDDFTADNGATRVVPGSHRASRNPKPDEAAEAVALEAPAGTMMVFDSRVWHRTGPNETRDRSRAGLFGWYTRPIYRTQENWFLALPPDFIDDASDELLTLLGWRTQGLGLVYGASPR